MPAALEKKENKVIGVAGGVGAAPLYPQLRKLAENGTKLTLSLVVRAKSMFYGRISSVNSARTYM